MNQAMNTAIVRAIFSKEWREHRSKYISYWLTMHAPILLLAIGIAFTHTARIPFVDLSDATAMKYLPLALVQPLFAATIFLIFTGYLAVATFSPSGERRPDFTLMSTGPSDATCRPFRSTHTSWERLAKL